MKSEVLKLWFSRLPVIVGSVLVVEAVVVAGATAWFRSIIDALIRLNDVVPNATDADEMSLERLASFDFANGGVQAMVLDPTGSALLGFSAAVTGMLLLGALAAVREFRFGTMARTVLHEPRRTVVLWRKVAAACAVGLGLAVTLVAVRLVIFVVALNVQGVTMVPGGGSVVAILVRGIGVLVVAAVAGVALGMLLRQQTPILVGLIVVGVVESTLRSVSVLAGGSIPFVEVMPFGLVAAAVRGASSGLAPEVALLILAGWAGGLLLLAAARFRRSELGFGLE